MELLIKQTRPRYSDTRNENKEETGSISSKDQNERTPQQKTQSFKRDRNNSQNWFRRQFSGHTSRRDAEVSNDIEYPTAVAAAAFAVNSVRDSRKTPPPRKPSEKPADATLTEIKSKSKTEGPSHVSDLRTASKRFSAEDLKKRVPSEKEFGYAPSMEKTPTFGEKQSDRTASRKEQEKVAVSKPDIPPQKNEVIRQSSIRPEIGDSEADAWEKAEMLKIKERHEKVMATISEWEEKKKVKARQRKEKAEGGSEKQRARAMRKYHEEMERISEIADGARAQAVENRRNDEFKVKEKANKIRVTGKLPPSCFCC